jgi:hypothetical protein
MKSQERLFALEMEFHRRLRQSCTGEAEDSEVHTSWAVGMGYEALIARSGAVTAEEVVRMAQRMMALGDPRDVMAARDSVMRLLGIGQFA